MKDHPERKGRLQLIEAMFAGHSWQTAVSQINRVRAKLGISTQRRGQTQRRTKKTVEAEVPTERK